MLKLTTRKDLYTSTEMSSTRQNNSSEMESTLSIHVQQPEKVMAESYRGLGLIDDSKGDVDGAIFNYNVAIEKCPYYQDAYINRSAAHFKKGDQEDALKDWLEGP